MILKKVVIIPARGGSKRFPRKNISIFKGLPLLLHSVACASDTGLFEKVYVSTEDEEISEIAKSGGADVLLRPSDLAGDFVSVDDVCLHHITHLQLSPEDILVTLYPASPLRTSNDILGTVELVEYGGADFAMTATPLPFDPHEALEIDKQGFAYPWNEVGLVAKRQFRRKLLIDAGSVYAAKVGPFVSNRGGYGPNLKLYEIPISRAFDIDTKDDLLRAEIYMDLKAAKSFS